MHRTGSVRLIVLLAWAVAGTAASGAEDAHDGKSGREAFRRGHSERMLALNNLAFLYRQRGERGEAKHLFVRALAALEATAGPGDPLMVTILRNLAVLCEETGDRSYAKALSKRARAIEATVSRTQISR